MTDPVNHPAHYTDHASGIECIEITEFMNFCRGNAVKYIWRAGAKGDAVTDLRKAIWYLEREISRINRQNPEPVRAPISYQRLLPDGSTVMEGKD